MGFVWDSRGACLLLRIRILGHNTEPWDWLTKNVSEEVYVCLCVFEKVR